MLIANFFKDDSGASSVDWTVITAGVVALGVATYAIIATGVFESSTELASDVETASYEAEEPLPEAQSDEFARDIVLVEDLSASDTPSIPEFANWDQANKRINLCIKTGGVPEFSATARTNSDGSPSEIICN